MDAGYSFHMTPNRLWFQQFAKLEGGYILLSDSSGYKITSIGTIKFCLHDGTEKMLEEVRYVPSLKRNLISLGELEKKGYVLKVKGGVEGDEEVMVVMKGVRKNALYMPWKVL
ncbi:hypothetical protein PHAVU_010G009750 [Phaseolus vulgaris]